MYWLGLSDVLKGGLLAKSGKFIFQGRSFLEGKIQKNSKNISKIFIVPKHLLGHTNHLYTYKGHIEQVGFTLKHQKTTEIAILSQNKAKMAIFVVFWHFYVKPTCSIWPL